MPSQRACEPLQKRGRFLGWRRIYRRQRGCHRRRGWFGVGLLGASCQRRDFVTIENKAASRGKKEKRMTTTAIDVERLTVFYKLCVSRWKAYAEQCRRARGAEAGVDNRADPRRREGANRRAGARDRQGHACANSTGSDRGRDRCRRKQSPLRDPELWRGWFACRQQFRNSAVSQAALARVTKI
jgi:hypothetical protein